MFRLKIDQGGRSSFIFNNRWFLFSLGLLLFVFYPAVLFGNYLFHDDLGSLREGCPFIPWLSVLGRPLGEKFACYQFAVLQSFDPIIARCLSILVLILLQGMIYIFIRKEKFPEFLSSFMSLSIIVLPGMLVFSGWLTTGYISVSLVFSMISALICQQILLKKSKKSTVTVWLLYFIAIILELSSNLIHQSGGMFFLVFFAFAFARAFYQNSSLLPRILRTYAMGFIPANLIYFIYFKINIATTLAQQDPTRGFLFHHQLMERLGWFFHYSMPRALNLWFNVNTSGWTIFSVIMGIIFIGSLGLFLYSFMQRKEAQYRIGKAAFYVVTIFLVMLCCYLPTLASGMNLNFFRSLIPLSSFFFLMSCIHFFLVFSKEGTQIKKIIMVLMIFIAFVANRVMLNEIIMPKYLEYHYLENIVQQIKIQKLESFPMHIIMAPIRPENNGLDTDEIGCINNSFEGHGSTLIEDMRKKLNMVPVTISESKAGEPFDAKGEIIINFSTLSAQSLRSDLEKMPMKITISP